MRSKRMSRKLGNSAAMRPFAKREVMPGRKLSAAKLTDFIRNGATTYFHEVGTCRMVGTRPPWSIRSCG